MIKKIEEILKNRIPGTIDNHKFFSVVIPLINRDGETEILFEVRASHLKTQPGDICLPGGRIEEGETPLEGALRELEEELGIPTENVRVLGQFDTLHGFSGYTLYTFIAEIKAEDFGKMKINFDEVEEVFTVPLSFFLSNEPDVYCLDVVSKTEAFPFEEAGISPDYNWRKGKNIVPVYHYRDKVIWGMTGRIVRRLTEEFM